MPEFAAYIFLKVMHYWLPNSYAYYEESRFYQGMAFEVKTLKVHLVHVSH
jgi:hypothetical protein